ncbi:hypothetical protein ASE61_25110 [Bosea sp. Root670]|nr:hypothetical protein ASE61_25110 [Bosea sp. Root670]
MKTAVAKWLEMAKLFCSAEKSLKRGTSETGVFAGLLKKLFQLLFEARTATCALWAMSAAIHSPRF